MPTDEELNQIDDLTGLDFSEITGLPAGATQHLYPTDQPAPLMNAPMLPAPKPVEQAPSVVPHVTTPAPVALIPFNIGDMPKATFINQENVFASSEFNAPATPLFVFGASRPSLFSAKAGKSGVIASFVGTDNAETPISADLTLPSLQ
jgi:hypothetical protein